MSSSQKKIKAHGGPPQTKTMFYNEGNPLALLVTNICGRRKEEGKIFKTAELALAWCRSNTCTLVYMPVNITHQ